MITRIFVVLLLSCSLLCAADNRPSEASVRQLLEVMQVQKALDTMMTQMDGVMKNAMAQVTQGQTVPPEAQEIFDKTRAEVVAVMQEQFTWDKMEPMYVRVYQASFTQEEVNGMIGFYKTPIGQSVVSKLPLVMQNTMNETMQMMGPMMQRIQQMQKDVVAKMRAPKEKKRG